MALSMKFLGNKYFTYPASILGYVLAFVGMFYIDPFFGFSFSVDVSDLSDGEIYKSFVGLSIYILVILGIAKTLYRVRK